MTAKKNTEEAMALEIDETPEDLPATPTPEAEPTPAPVPETVTNDVADEDQPQYVTDPGSDKEQRVSQLSAEELDKLKQKLRHAAERKVIDNHRDEYNQIAEEMFRAEGLEFTRRKTAEERAADRIKKVMEEQGISREQMLLLLNAE